MKKLLENIIKELNPKHDFDFMKLWNNPFNNLTQFIILNLIKPFGRGALIGSSLGVLGSFVFNYNLDFGFKDGAYYGAVIDSQQYYFRGAYHYLKKRGYLDVFN